VTTTFAIFPNNSVIKETDFNNFSYTEYETNVTPENHKLVHLTCNTQPLYLVKLRLLRYWLSTSAVSSAR